MREKSTITLQGTILVPGRTRAQSTFMFGEFEEDAVKIDVFHAIKDTVRETEAEAWRQIAVEFRTAANEADERAALLRG